MKTPQQSGGSIPFALQPMQEDNAARARDRVLLYTRGMAVDPVLGLELALESLRRAERAGPKDDGIHTAMNELHALLREKGIDLEVPDERGAPLRSAPPMTRRPMVAEEMDRSPLRRLAKKLLALFVRKDSS